MLHRLDVATVMPPEEAGLPGVDVSCHGPRPVGPGDTSQPSVHCFLNVWEPVAALQCITAMTHAPRDLGQLAADLAFPGWQVVSVARHLGRLRQAPSNYLSVCCISHITLSHKSTGLSSCLCACGLRLAAPRLASRIRRRSIQ